MQGKSSYQNRQYNDCGIIILTPWKLIVYVICFRMMKSCHCGTEIIRRYIWKRLNSTIHRTKKMRNDGQDNVSKCILPFSLIFFHKMLIRKGMKRSAFNREISTMIIFRFKGDWKCFVKEYFLLFDMFVSCLSSFSSFFFHFRSFFVFLFCRH